MGKCQRHRKARQKVLVKVWDAFESVGVKVWFVISRNVDEEELP